MEPLLPLNTTDLGNGHAVGNGVFAESPMTMSPMTMKSPLGVVEEKMEEKMGGFDDGGGGGGGGGGSSVETGGWLSPGTRQEETWRPRAGVEA
jgi:hypothetical protein